MFQPIHITEIELGNPLTDLDDLGDYHMVSALVRHRGKPVGRVEVPVVNGRCSAKRLRETIERDLAYPILYSGLERHLGLQTTEHPPSVADILEPSPEVLAGDGAVSGAMTWPVVTVAVCTRGNRSTLTECLTAISELDYPQLDLLVVENAPVPAEAEQLVRQRFPHLRYVCEPRPGLDNARNRAIVEAKGEIVAYTDDDVIVDRYWVRALAHVFVADPDVTCVAGLVAPAELETESQWLFEQYGGFGRGYWRTWYRGDHTEPGDVTRRHGGTGKFGTGANMAFRREFLLQVGGFDPALDVGTPTNGGGDLDMFYRVLKEGHTLVYEPQALVLHKHRRTLDQLHEQIRNNGIGLYSFFVRNFLTYRQERLAFVMLGLWWFWWWNIRRLVRSYIKPSPLPRSLIWTELLGSFAGLVRYQQSRDRQQHTVTIPPAPEVMSVATPRKGQAAAAVRTVDLAQPLRALDDVSSYRQTYVYVLRQGQLLGSAIITNDYHPISALQLTTAIAEKLGLQLLASRPEPHADIHAASVHFLRNWLENKAEPGKATSHFSSDIPVSIVVATHDRPQDLRRCLRALSKQQTGRPLEIIVVDNHPDSGQTLPIANDFPAVRYVTERRQGVSYARNAGILASSGDIIVFTDDDVVMPSDWLEKLLAPFAQANVSVVAGNVLPRELETESQRLFEEYGGLGRGYTFFQVDRSWYEQFRFMAVPTWVLGGTANTAFLARLFRDPRVGLMDEVLGPGTPTGVGEDTLLFYQALRAGYTIAYEPTAYVWHKHRETHEALRRQLYNYSKGHVAYHLTTLWRYRDWRVFFQLCFWLPGSHVWRLTQRLKRRSDYPLRLTLVEVLGNLAGPWVWLRSLWRVRRLGRSQSPRTTGVRPSVIKEQEVVSGPAQT